MLSACTKILIGGLAVSSASTVYGAAVPLKAREHSLEPLEQAVQSNNLGPLIIQHKPYLVVEDGCDPYPAVLDDGTTNTGLKPTGASDGDCKDSEGQVYARTQYINGMLAIMYSWYFPKDHAELPFAIGSIGGHRHDWENIVVFLQSTDDSYKFRGVTASAHGEYSGVAGDDMSLWDNDHPVITYDNQEVNNHGLSVRDSEDTAVGEVQPLVDWSSLSDAAKEALETTDWGDASVPFKSESFSGNIEEAYDSLWGNI